MNAYSLGCWRRVAANSTRVECSTRKPRPHRSHETDAAPRLRTQRMFAGTFGFDDRPGRALVALIRADFFDRDGFEAERQSRRVRREAVVVLFRGEEFRVGDDAVL